MLLGIHLTLLIGPTVAVPAPAPLTEALQSVRISAGDDGPSGFQITFQTGRGGPLGVVDYPLLGNPLLRPFNRVILIATFNATPRVLLDGIITDHQFAPGDEPGQATMTITGEDVSVMMDREEKSAEHPAQDETIIALKIIAAYAKFGLIPRVIPPLAPDPPIPIERVPVQQGTDLAYLRQMARRHGYVFSVTPGPAPFTNTAYWGPPVRVGLPQPALSVNLEGATNVEKIDFRFNALGPTVVAGRVQDRNLNEALPVRTFASLRPPLASQPAWLVHAADIRSAQFREPGLTVTQAFARAQGLTDAASDAVEAVGELDAVRYNGVLAAGALVGLRGVGYSYDGFWYVKRVVHTIKKESYKQQFTLTREGVGSTTPVVLP